MTTQPSRTLLHCRTMKTTEQEIRTLRKKAKSWLAILCYDCAKGAAHLTLFSKRLQSLCEPVLRPEILKEIIRNNLPKTESKEEAYTTKKRIMSRLTPDKVSRRVLSFPKIRIRKAPNNNQAFSLTLGRLMIIWAVLTNQPVADFAERILPDVNRLSRDWHDATGCTGLSDEECSNHQKETAIFWSGFYRTLIRATPEENLIQFRQNGLRALGAVLETAGMGKMIVKLIGQAIRLITKDTTQKFKFALKENPQAKKRIDIPELQALVLREEIRLGWNNNTQQDAQEILQEGLSPELKEAIDEKEEVIRSSMEAVGRRGLFNNLMASIDGQLKSRFVNTIQRFLQSMTTRVVSTWEFEPSTSIKEQMNRISQWLFRRS